MSTKKKPSPESIVREIKRKTRRKYSAKEKIQIVLEGLRGEQSITDLCCKEGIHPDIYYKWSKAFLEAGKQRLTGDTVREAGSEEVGELRAENEELKQLVAELSIRNRKLKKTLKSLELRINQYMKYSQPEKMEIIRMVEDSNLSVRKTLQQIEISRSTFYEWYRRYQKHGYEGLALKRRTPHQFWNAIPEWERQRVVEVAREYPEKSCRELAFHITDKEGYFISESSVYRILKAHNLVTSPVHTVISAKDQFEHPTTRVNELWQTDFTYLKVIDWGWYYLLTVLDDYSRYIIAWRLCKSMKAEDVKKTLEIAIAKTGVKHVHIYHRPMILSDNGSCFISTELKDYLSHYDMKHIRTRTYHPMIQGKIERYHRSMKNLILLDNYYSPTDLEARISEWVDHYNNHRYHEAIVNVTPSDRFFGKDKEILEQRQGTKA